MECSNIRNCIVSRIGNRNYTKYSYTHIKFLSYLLFNYVVAVSFLLFFSVGARHNSQSNTAFPNAINRLLSLFTPSSFVLRLYHQIPLASFRLFPATIERILRSFHHAINVCSTHTRTYTHVHIHTHIYHTNI